MASSDGCYFLRRILSSGGINTSIQLQMQVGLESVIFFLLTLRQQLVVELLGHTDHDHLVQVVQLVGKFLGQVEVQPRPPLHVLGRHPSRVPFQELLLPVQNADQVVDLVQLVRLLEFDGARLLMFLYLEEGVDDDENSQEDYQDGEGDHGLLGAVIYDMEDGVFPSWHDVAFSCSVVCERRGKTMTPNLSHSQPKYLGPGVIERRLVGSGVVSDNQKQQLMAAQGHHAILAVIVLLWQLPPCAISILYSVYR
mmetsp:Transcript_34862/g.74318  ORF Transcript_34862/g.74318 Transcript_34862/m.74318 type:complete len:253 (-) Transcript_34862:3-761(-)